MEKGLLYQLTTASVMALLLAGCSGGSATTTPTTPTNSAPVVDAGTNQTVAEGASVQLDASASDADGDTLSYSWSQSSGASVTLSSTSAQDPTFTAPDVTGTEDIVFELHVSDGTTSVTDSVTITIVDTSSSLVKPDLFSADLVSSAIISCTLDNGNQTLCFELVFPSNAVGSDVVPLGVGPFCPTTDSTPRSEAGVGIYDGTTNPGFLPLLDAALAMEADGYDIIDTDGTIFIGNPSESTNTLPVGASACLEASFDDNLTLTYQIPIEPVLRSTNYIVESIGDVGVGVNGVPYKGAPPSTVNGPAGMPSPSGTANIPSLDPCGGHPDPQGYYHWHFVPQSMNNVLTSVQYNYTALHGITCENLEIASDEPYAFAGIAQDGYPIYGARDFVSGMAVLPETVTALDDCNGHEHATAEYPDGAYHYHALDETAPNMLQCLKGEYSTNFFSFQ